MTAIEDRMLAPLQWPFDDLNDVELPRSLTAISKAAISKTALSKTART